jgi:hypothetical protein
MFIDKEPLKTMYQFSRRVTSYKEAVKMKNSGMIAHPVCLGQKLFSEAYN